jgi:hypothetical protein
MHPECRERFKKRKSRHEIGRGKMKNKAGGVFKYRTRTGARLWRFRFDVDPVDGQRRQAGKAGSPRGARPTTR